MWGYIALLHIAEGAIRGSLTVCEGISHSRRLVPENCRFPYCMWGYIVCCLLSVALIWVPSLYVRVYRPYQNCLQNGCSSLTVCEGVSPFSYLFFASPRSPHCMWGCITYEHVVKLIKDVPSLYVRVYRGFALIVIIINCSLTVCEGVSCGFSERFKD